MAISPGSPFFRIETSTTPSSSATPGQSSVPPPGHPYLVALLYQLPRRILAAGAEQPPQRSPSPSPVREDPLDSLRPIISHPLPLPTNDDTPLEEVPSSPLRRILSPAPSPQEPLVPSAALGNKRPRSSH